MVMVRRENGSEIQDRVGLVGARDLKVPTPPPFFYSPLLGLKQKKNQRSMKQHNGG